MSSAETSGWMLSVSCKLLYVCLIISAYLTQKQGLGFIEVTSSVSNNQAEAGVRVSRWLEQTVRQSPTDHLLLRGSCFDSWAASSVQHGMCTLMSRRKSVQAELKESLSYRARIISGLGLGSSLLTGIKLIIKEWD